MIYNIYISYVHNISESSTSGVQKVILFNCKNTKRWTCVKSAQNFLNSVLENLKGKHPNSFLRIIKHMKKNKDVLFFPVARQMLGALNLQQLH